ncbi:UvrD-helicase domain-containing protein [Amycolatopsis sp. La24]|uniref:UvrD-helicase domain-containing protein n=1 Tax=Amycolatopsis sp. La24 TaxID=3028304 RepID=UPI0023B1A881|nr:UvrD-helicase domain-containing protein [Amycolatopsis sp. La24]
MTIVDALTEEQRAVVEQPADALVLVTAGPGTGKTHTLVRRLEYLLAQNDVAAGEVLVLTFSRAAVRELQVRLSAVAGAARHCRARTFDSWALELLTAVDPDGEWRSRSFDERVRAATRAVQEGLVDAFCEDLTHVVIDEIQDLVSDRRVLVESVLERFLCGFTVVGDPAQAIYGFQVTDPEKRNFETNRFFTRMRELFAEELVELSLSENFRVRDSSAEVALRFGGVLQNALADPVEVCAEVRGALLDVEPFGNLYDDFARTALSRSDITTAVLCRTNGESMLVSEELHRAGVVHRLQRSARDRVVPKWIGRLFTCAEGLMLTRSTFDALVPVSVLGPNNDPDRAWTSSLRASSRGTIDRSVDLANLRAALASGRLPDELSEQLASSLTVSSFHRAKGLEFDRVIISDPGTRGSLVEDSGEEARMLYVAMTRARDDVLRIDSHLNSGVRKDRSSDRWARYGWKNQRLGLEVSAGDVLPDVPAGMRAFIADPVELQEYLSDAVRPADEVVLELAGDVSSGPNESPEYVVLHDERPIGTVSRRFRTDLMRFLGWGGRATWPSRIIRLRIDAVETVVGSAAAAAGAGLGSHGVWLAPRVSGLGVFLYGGATGPEEM